MRTARTRHARASTRPVARCSTTRTATAETSRCGSRIAEGEVAKATLLLRERDERIAGQDAELVELRADKTRRDEAELVRAVNLAFDLWRIDGNSVTAICLCS